MWLQLFKSILNLFCGTSQQAPSQSTGAQQSNGQWSSQPHHQASNNYPPGQQWQQGAPAHTPTHGKIHSREQYVALRAEANEQGDLMARAFKDSHESYARGNGAEAKDLSNQGKEHQRKMQELNKQACDFIFAENNKGRGPGEVDLHDLYVKEAIQRADQAIDQAKRQGLHQIDFIVGKGLHSAGGVAKIKPAIEELLQKHQLTAKLDPQNAGVLNVLLQTNERGMNADEISRRLERDDEGCTIM